MIFLLLKTVEAGGVVIGHVRRATACYSRDLVPLEFHLFGRRFSRDDEVKAALHRWLRARPKPLKRRFNAGKIADYVGNAMSFAKSAQTF